MLDQTKVLLVSDLYPPDPGDISKAVQRTAKLVKPFLQSVEILTFSGDLAPGTVTTDMENEVLIYRLGIPKKSQEALETIGDFLTLIHQKNKYQIFHLFTILYAGYMGIFQGAYHSVKSLLSIRRDEMDLTITDPSRFAISNWSLSQASGVTCTSPDLKKKISALKGNEERIFVLSDSIDTTFYEKKKKIQLALPEGRLIGHMGELRVKYGFKILLHSFQVIATKLLDTHLILIGDLGEEEEGLLNQFMHASNLKNRIHHYAFLEDDQVPYYLSAFELLVFPALRGDIPRMALKGMSCEQKLICSEMGGFRDLIHHKVNGYLSPPGNPRALSVRILKALESPNLEMGKLARKTILKGYTYQKEQEELLSIYKILLATL